jgi:protein-disulfide isomerase
MPAALLSMVVPRSFADDVPLPPTVTRPGSSWHIRRSLSGSYRGCRCGPAGVFEDGKRAYFQAERQRQIKLLAPGAVNTSTFKPSKLQSFTVPSQFIGGNGGSSAAENAAKRLAEQTQKQLIEKLAEGRTYTQNIPFTVGSVFSSGIAGVQKGSLTFDIPGQGKRSESFYITEDKRFLLLGQIVDLTVDPFVEIMKKIDISDSPSKGPEGAKVKIVEYSDFQCPYCARAFATIEGDVLKKYGKKVRFIYKHFPLPMHNWAVDAAIGADCAYLQNKKAFWGFYDKLYKNQAGN